MVSMSTWCRYVAHKFVYSWHVSYKAAFSYLQNGGGGHIKDDHFGDMIWKNLFQGRLTFLHRNEGDQMAPTIAGQGGTVLVRKIPFADPTRVFVGDVVLLKDPEDSKSYLIRRLAAMEGDDMVSTDEKDIPFVLDSDECWVVSDNNSLPTKEAHDSRSFGPIPSSDIVGRVLYSMRTAVDHGQVANSKFGMRRDDPVLAVELDVDEMTKYFSNKKRRWQENNEHEGDLPKN